MLGRCLRCPSLFPRIGFLLNCWFSGVGFLLRSFLLRLATSTAGSPLDFWFFVLGQKYGDSRGEFEGPFPKFSFSLTICIVAPAPKGMPPDYALKFFFCSLGTPNFPFCNSDFSYWILSFSPGKVSSSFLVRIFSLFFFLSICRFPVTWTCPMSFYFFPPLLGTREGFFPPCPNPNVPANPSRRLLFETYRRLFPLPFFFISSQLQLNRSFFTFSARSFSEPPPPLPFPRLWLFCCVNKRRLPYLPLAPCSSEYYPPSAALSVSQVTCPPAWIHTSLSLPVQFFFYQ